MNIHAISFLFFGIALLTPWNVWIQLTGLLEVRLVGSSVANSFEGLISVTYQVANLFILLTLLSLRSYYGFKLSETKRIVFGLWLLAMIFSSSILLVFSKIEGMILFNILLLLVAISALCGSLLTSFVGLASSFPSASMSYLSTGQGISAILPSISQLISPFGPEVNAALCFIESIVVALICLFGYSRIMKLRENYYEVIVTNSEEEEEVSVKTIIKDTLLATTAVFLNLIITLSLFPAITASVEDDFFTRLVLVHFLIYNFFDLLGKFLTLYISLPPRPALILTFGRIAFVPLILMCNVTLKGNTRFPHLFGTCGYLIILSLFGLSNGFLTAISFVNSTDLIKAPSNIKYQICGDIMQFSLTLGLTIGSIFSFFLQEIL